MLRRRIFWRYLVALVLGEGRHQNLKPAWEVKSGGVPYLNNYRREGSAQQCANLCGGSADRAYQWQRALI